MTGELPVGRPVTGWRGAEPMTVVPLAGRWATVVPLRVDHAPELWRAYAADPAGRGWTYLPYGPFAGEGAFTEWVAECAVRSDVSFRAVLVAGAARGMASFLRDEPAAGSCEIGHLHAAPGLQRTAALTEALSLMIGEVFRRGHRRCEWKCDALNERSRAAAQRLGFSFEGVFRQAAVVKGRNRDTAWFAMVDADWPAIRSAHHEWFAAVGPDGTAGLSLSRLTAPLLVDPLVAPVGGSPPAALDK